MPNASWSFSNALLLVPGRTQRERGNWSSDDSHALSVIACGEASTAIMKYAIVTNTKAKRIRGAFMPRI